MASREDLRPCRGHPQAMSDDDPFLPLDEQLAVAQGLQPQLFRFEVEWWARAEVC
jgi:hypothetical protein